MRVNKEGILLRVFVGKDSKCVCGDSIDGVGWDCYELCIVGGVVYIFDDLRYGELLRC